MNEKTGFFTMQDVNEVINKGDLILGKEYLQNRINTFISVHPNTEQHNIVKANHMINNATSLKKLGISVANFILARESSKFKVI